MEDPTCPYLVSALGTWGNTTPGKIIVLVQHLVMLQALRECGGPIPWDRRAQQSNMSQ